MLVSDRVIIVNLTKTTTSFCVSLLLSIIDALYCICWMCTFCVHYLFGLQGQNLQKKLTKLYINVGMIYSCYFVKVVYKDMLCVLVL